MYNTDIKESSNENFGGETLDSGPLGTPASRPLEKGCGNGGKDGGWTAEVKG